MIDLFNVHLRSSIKGPRYILNYISLASVHTEAVRDLQVLIGVGMGRFVPFPIGMCKRTPRQLRLCSFYQLQAILQLKNYDTNKNGDNRAW